MRVIASILFVFVISSSFAQDYSQITFDKNGVYMMQYYQNDLDSNKTAFMFKLIEPKFMRTTRKIIRTGNQGDTKKVLRKDSFEHYYIPKINKTKCIKNSKLSIPFGYSKVGPQWAHIPLKDDADTVLYTYDSLISKGALLMKAIDEIPSSKDSNEYIFLWGHYTPFRETICHSGPGSTLVKKVQLALIPLGYDLQDNNQLDEKTRNAIIDYQKKNNLPVGNLNVETMKHLGIEGY